MLLKVPKAKFEENKGKSVNYSEIRNKNSVCVNLNMRNHYFILYWRNQQLNLY